MGCWPKVRQSLTLGKGDLWCIDGSMAVTQLIIIKAFQLEEGVLEFLDLSFHLVLLLVLLIEPDGVLVQLQLLHFLLKLGALGRLLD